MPEGLSEEEVLESLLALGSLRFVEGVIEVYEFCCIEELEQPDTRDA